MRGVWFFIAALAACTVGLCFAAPAHSAYNPKAGRMYAVASRRLAELKKSPKKRQYRSYWIDCARTFKLVHNKLPKVPQAGAACLDLDSFYRDL